MNNKEKPDTRQAEYKRKSTIILSIAGGVFLIFLILMEAILINEAKKSQEIDNDRFFSTTIANLNNNEKEINMLSKDYDENNAIMINNLVRSYSYTNYVKLKSLSVEKQCDLLLYTTYTMENCIWLLVVNSDSDILISNVLENVGENLLESDDVGLSEKDFHDLCDGKIDKVVIDNPYDDIDSSGESLYLYAKPIPGSLDEGGIKYVLIAFSSSILDTAKDRMEDLSAWLNSSSVGTNGAVFMVDAKNDTIKYGAANNTDLTGLKASDVGFDKSVLHDRFRGYATINGTKYYISVRSYSSKLYGEDSYIIAAVPSSNLYAINIEVMIWNAFLILVFSTLILVYSSYMRSKALKEQVDLKGIRLSKSRIYSRHLSAKIFPMVTFCTLLVLALAFYFRLLMQLSDSFADSVAVVNDITRNLEESYEIKQDFIDYYDKQYLNRAKLLAYIVEMNGGEYMESVGDNKGLDLFTDPNDSGERKAVKDDYNNQIRVVDLSTGLATLLEENELEDMYIMSDTGVTLATSSSYWEYSLSDDPNDSSYAFRDILSGKQESVVLDPVEDEDGRITQRIGVSMYYYTCLDDDGKTKYVSLPDYWAQTAGTYKGNEITHHRGMLEVVIDIENDEGFMKSATPEYVLKNTKLSDDGSLLGFYYDDKKDEYAVFYSPVSTMVGKTASELGISDKAFTGNYNGFQKLDSETYLQSFRKSDQYYIATAMPVSSIYLSCIITALFCTLFSLIVMFFIALYAVVVPDMDDEERYREENDLFAMFGHWNKIGNWKNDSASRTFEFVIKDCLIILGGVFLAAIFLEAYRYRSSSAISYILKGGWDRGIHIFSLSSCIVLIILSYIVIRMFSHMARLIASAFGSRGVTIMRLVSALFKVAAVFGVVMYCLYLIGIDATSLLASAGIMSVVVGLGAQSLVGDLLAGIFIIMEGALHVGDYVLIDGVRGKVVEIGLRTTRYEDDNQNIRIICNNEMKVFANMSMKYSVVLYNIPVPYDQDYVKIRKVLNSEFIQLYQDNKDLKGIPVCQGIEEFSESSVDLRVRFVCDESSRLEVQRYMHDEIMRIFTENDIHIPFNQLDIHVERLLSDQK